MSLFVSLQVHHSITIQCYIKPPELSLTRAGDFLIISVCPSTKHIVTPGITSGYGLHSSNSTHISCVMKWHASRPMRRGVCETWTRDRKACPQELPRMPLTLSSSLARRANKPHSLEFCWGRALQKQLSRFWQSESVIHLPNGILTNLGSIRWNIKRLKYLTAECVWDV